MYFGFGLYNPNGDKIKNLEDAQEGSRVRKEKS